MRYERRLINTCWARSATSARRRSRVFCGVMATKIRVSQHAAQADLAVSSFPPHALLFEPQVKLEDDRPVGHTTQVAVAFLGDLQLDVVAVDLEDARLMVGHEATEFLDRHLGGHGRDQRLLDDRVGVVLGGRRVVVLPLLGA